MQYIIVNCGTGRQWIAAGMGEAILYAHLSPYYLVYEKEPSDGKNERN